MNWHPLDRIGLAFIAALWTWKVAEYAGRQTGLLDRNLGWGFYVDFTIPVVVTAAFLLFVAFREITRLLVRQVPQRFVWAAITIIASLVFPTALSHSMRNL